MPVRKVFLILIGCIGLASTTEAAPPPDSTPPDKLSFDAVKRRKAELEAEEATKAAVRKKRGAREVVELLREAFDSDLFSELSFGLPAGLIPQARILASHESSPQMQLAAILAIERDGSNASLGALSDLLDLIITGELNRPHLIVPLATSIFRMGSAEDLEIIRSEDLPPDLEALRQYSNHRKVFIGLLIALADNRTNLRGVDLRLLPTINGLLDLQPPPETVLTVFTQNIAIYISKDYLTETQAEHVLVRLAQVKSKKVRILALRALGSLSSPSTKQAVELINRKLHSGLGREFVEARTTWLKWKELPIEGALADLRVANPLTAFDRFSYRCVEFVSNLGR